MQQPTREYFLTHGKLHPDKNRYSQYKYTWDCMFPKWGDWDIQYTRQGLRRQRIKQMMKLVAFVSFIAGLFSVRKQPLTSLGGIPTAIKQTIKLALLAGTQRLGRGVDWLAA